MSAVDFSLSPLGPVANMDLSSVQGPGVSAHVRNAKVAKAMEALFVSQLTAEFGKSIDGGADSSSSSGSTSSDNDSAANGPYSDFIQQAMTQGVSSGGHFGLAKIIENYLNQRDQTKAAVHLPLKTPNTSYHVNHIE